MILLSNKTIWQVYCILTSIPIFSLFPHHLKISMIEHTQKTTFEIIFRKNASNFLWWTSKSLFLIQRTPITVLPMVALKWRTNALKWLFFNFFFISLTLLLIRLLRIEWCSVIVQNITNLNSNVSTNTTLQNWLRGIRGIISPLI